MSMKKKDKKYLRLPGKKRRTLGKDTLWAGPDHLLLIESSGMSESYRRFYYKDIKSIVIAKTREAFYKTLFVFAIFLVCLILGCVLWLDDQNPASVFFWVTCPVFLVYFLVCLIGGPSCVGWIVTAVRREKLTPVNRLRPAMNMMAKLKPRIDAVQGTLDRESLNRLFDTGGESQQTLARLTPEEKPLVYEKGLWHKALFLLLLVMAGLSVVVLFYRPYPLFIMGTLLFVGMGITTVVALVRQTGSRLSSTIKNLTWASLVLMILGFIQSYAEMFFQIFQRAKLKQPALDQLTMFKMHAQTNPFDYPVFLTLDMIQAGLCLIIGIWGLILLTRQV